MYVRPIPEEGEPEVPKEGFGYISRAAAGNEPASYRACVFYDSEEKSEYFDGMWRLGKAMSIIATILGFAVMCTVMCTCCVAYELRTFDSLFWVCIICFVAQALTFLSWGSNLCDEYECTWSSGTGMNITASMLWVWAANMIKSFPEALPPRGRGRRKAPVYEDEADDDFYTEDSPYHRRGDAAYDDDYDESSEFIDIQNDENRGYSDEKSYDDDGYSQQYDGHHTGYPTDDATYNDNQTYDDKAGEGEGYGQDDYTYDESQNAGGYDYGDQQGGDWADQQDGDEDDRNNEDWGDKDHDNESYDQPTQGNADDYYEDEYSQGYSETHGKKK
jgi:hypothetical protein